MTMLSNQYISTSEWIHEGILSIVRDQVWQSLFGRLAYYIGFEERLQAISAESELDLMINH